MKSSKRLFIGLLVVTLLIIAVSAIGLWSFNLFGFNVLGQVVIFGLGVIFSGVGLILVTGLIGILVTIQRGKPVPVLVIPTKLVISYFLPVIVQLGGFLGLDQERIMASFVEVGNQLVDPEEIDVQPEEVMILTPHCLQWSQCPHRVTGDTDNCQRCGKCQIDDLIALTEKYGVHLEVATGGTLARRKVKEIKPKVIVAIACERDLSSGIQDVYPLPVVGVVNMRPNGPCFDTQVDMEKVEKAIKQILK